MQVRKAVITAAGRGPGQYPPTSTVQRVMLPMVDRDGLTKPVIQIIAEEALDSGIEELCIVTAPGDEAAYQSQFDQLEVNLRGCGDARGLEQQARLADLRRRLSFAAQTEPTGYGHAVWCARKFIGADPFLLLVSDHLYISGEQRRCARQLIDLAVEQNCAVAAVQSTREHLIHHYGTVAGRRVGGLGSVFQIEEIIEKPTPSLAEQKLHVPGLRVGHYLCFFGMHVLTPTLLSILEEDVRRQAGQGPGVQLTPALLELARSEKYLAMRTNGRRYNIGVKYGGLEAQIAMAVHGSDREEVLARLMELIIQSELDARRPGDSREQPA